MAVVILHVHKYEKKVTRKFNTIKFNWQLFSYTGFFLSPPHSNQPPRSPTQRVPPERDGNYDKPEFVQPQEETLVSIVLN